MARDKIRNKGKQIMKPKIENMKRAYDLLNVVNDQILRAFNVKSIDQIENINSEFFDMMHDIKRFKKIITFYKNRKFNQGGN